jgi:hypothetical protein
MRERKVAWILLRGASVDSLRDGVLTLNFVREGDAKGFAGGGHDRALARVLQEMLGISPQIRTVVGAPDGAASAAGAAPTGRATAAGSDWDLPPGGDAGSGGRQQRPEHAGPAPDGSGRQTGGTRRGVTRTGGTQPGGAQNGGAGSGAAQPGGAFSDDAQRGGDFDADALSGADLIQRELGGQVIAETGDA